MQTQTLPLNEIILEDRQRKDLGDITSLCKSIERFGLLQPILINQNKRLLAGGRRYAAHVQLGLPTILVTYRETLTETELFECELEENVQRLDMHWTERCLNIHRIHVSRQKLTIEAGDFSWTQRKTGELLGVEVGNLNVMLQVARKLQSEIDSTTKTFRKDGRFSSCESCADAYRLILRDKEDELQAANAADLQSQIASNLLDTTSITQDETLAQVFAQQIEQTSVEPDALSAARTQYYSNPLNPPDSFDQYWSERQAKANEVRNTIYLSSRLILADSIEYMNRVENAGRFDHIITDIPYGIDMDHLAQTEGMQDIDTVAELHDVNYNLQLIKDFFPASFACTKPNAFVVTWCDQMLWQYMYDLAIAAGFAVQRWPITWVKTSSCINQGAQYNTTKNTEIAIVCRKQGATLATKSSTSVLTASRNDHITDVINHKFAKPFACWEFLTQLVSIENQTILEPFAGRGSGVLSMLTLKRNVIGIERDQTHYNYLLDNIKNQHYLKINPNYVFK